MRRLARAVAGLLALAVWAGMILLGLTGMTHFQPQTGTVSISNRGSARVINCAEIGPIGFLGGGYWWICRARVRWDGGATESIITQPGQLTPADVGREVPVVERLVLGDEGGGPPTPQVYRADFEPSAVLGVGSMIAGIGLGGLLAVLHFRRHAVADRDLTAWGGRGGGSADRHPPTRRRRLPEAAEPGWMEEWNRWF